MKAMSATTLDMIDVSYDDIVGAAARLTDVAHVTPVVTSRTINEWTSAQIYFKCENFQRAGAFKFRGAYNAMVQLTAEEKRRGVVTYSSGNHAQAIALAGRILDVPTTIVMPNDAPPVKVSAVRGYGGTVVMYDRHETLREQLGVRLSEEQGLTLIPPYDHPDVMCGQGTCAKEMIEQVGPMDVLLVPCGGGGLLAGSALSVGALAPSCRVIGVEPEAGDDGVRSFRSGIIQTVLNPDTIADGARTPSLGVRNFAIIKRDVSDMVSVTDASIVRAMRMLWERLKLVVEPTGAMGLAALLDNTVVAKNLRVGVILSGGNADIAALAPRFAAPP